MSNKELIQDTLKDFMAPFGENDEVCAIVLEEILKKLYDRTHLSIPRPQGQKGD